ncbi:MULTISPECIES: hypothetical protein [unclassified Curtobacterium]|uniref:hypothetical protein n=1 Tax=unclassified Curtobacterium TaxID=257496 RepID=UPI00203EDC06|nr:MULTISPECIES: hypothetical protein [unclassified Curtobacterium]MCM3504128.1 hypothetical protein [Curtobacterium sp. ODYSSEY 48 V2]MDB6427803.1 hypothetical protein [Curtobacterium sp. 20TX0008]
MTAGATVGTDERSGWTRPGWVALYWATVGLGVLGGACSWLWLFLASEEATRGATPDRSGANPGIPLGLVGLVVGHVVGFLLLLMVARLARHGGASAAGFAVLGLVIGSGVGLACSLALTGGALVVPWPDAPYTP